VRPHWRLTSGTAALCVVAGVAAAGWNASQGDWLTGLYWLALAAIFAEAAVRGPDALRLRVAGALVGAYVLVNFVAAITREDWWMTAIYAWFAVCLVWIGRTIPRPALTVEPARIAPWAILDS
jgi:hypothetical protein